MKKQLVLIAFIFTFYSIPGFAKTHEVLVMNKSKGQTMVFEPMFLKVEVGDIVSFIPKSKGHTSQSVFTPKGAESWKGKTSKEMSITLDKEGVYIYECKNHGIMGMAAVLQVGRAVNITKAKEFFGNYKKKFIMHKERLIPIINKIK